MKVTHTPGFTPPPVVEETFTLELTRNEMRALLAIANWPDLVSRKVFESARLIRIASQVEMHSLLLGIRDRMPRELLRSLEYRDDKDC